MDAIFTFLEEKITSMRAGWKTVFKIVITVIILLAGVVNQIALRRNVVSTRMGSATSILCVSLLSLLHRKFLAKELRYTAHLFFERIDVNSKPPPGFEWFVVMISLLFLFMSGFVLVQEIGKLW